jgi:hypothetical protein
MHLHPKAFTILVLAFVTLGILVAIFIGFRIRSQSKFVLVQLRDEQSNAVITNARAALNGIHYYKLTGNLQFLPFTLRAKTEMLDFHCKDGLLHIPKNVIVDRQLYFKERITVFSDKYLYRELDLEQVVSLPKENNFYILQLSRRNPEE